MLFGEHCVGMSGNLSFPRGHEIPNRPLARSVVQWTYERIMSLWRSGDNESWEHLYGLLPSRPCWRQDYDLSNNIFEWLRERFSPSFPKGHRTSTQKRASSKDLSGWKVGASHTFFISLYLSHSHTHTNIHTDTRTRTHSVGGKA